MTLSSEIKEGMGCSIAMQGPNAPSLYKFE